MYLRRKNILHEYFDQGVCSKLNLTNFILFDIVKVFIKNIKI